MRKKAEPHALLHQDSITTNQVFQLSTIRANNKVERTAYRRKTMTVST